MKIEFTAKETFEAIHSEFLNKENNHHYYIQAKDFEDMPYGETHWIRDHTWQEAIARCWVSDNLIRIKTSWSKFEYFIAKQADGSALVTYIGAFKGLLRQQLLPNIGLDLTQFINVESTMDKELPLAHGIKNMSWGNTELNGYIAARMAKGLAGLNEDREFGLPRPFWGHIKNNIETLEPLVKVIKEYWAEEEA